MGNYRINKLEMYLKYTEKVGPTVTQFGGKTLVVDQKPVVLEGEPYPSTVVVEFPSKQAALDWYRSPEYQSIIDLRKNAVTGWVQERKYPIDLPSFFITSMISASLY